MAQRPDPCYAECKRCRAWQAVSFRNPLYLRKKEARNAVEYVWIMVYACSMELMDLCSMDP